MKMSEVKSVYFIGIGGIGMSALARYFNEHGVTVSGYDKTKTPLTSTLEQEGITIYYNEDVSRIPKDVDLVVYTPAIPSTHSVLNYYQQSETLVLKRAQVLGKIVNEGDCYGVAGSHGKSTTSAMLAHVFQVAGKNCTGFLGAIASNYNSNYISGSPSCFVVESDEYDRSFLNILPTSTIITSIDSDHLDIYGDMDGVRIGFNEYANNVRENGSIFIHEDAVTELESRSDIQLLTYSLNSTADFYANDLQQIEGGFQFNAICPTKTINNIVLPMGGQYNVENALAVIAISTVNGVDEEAIRKGLASFKGLKRRFEKVISEPQITFIDDYAHHPNEIRAFIKGVRELYPNKRIGAIFQPHLYSRTQDYAEHFAQSLDIVDEVLIMNIYPAREEPIEGVSSSLIYDAMENGNKQIVADNDVVQKALDLPIDVLVTIGAGDISKQVPQLKEALTKKFALA